MPSDSPTKTGTARKWTLGRSQRGMVVIAGWTAAGPIEVREDKVCEEDVEKAATELWIALTTRLDGLTAPVVANVARQVLENVFGGSDVSK